ncbi:DegV family protein [Lacticaseibacillus jixianensis]|uniref:DegV family protein n=1 Tax=Lacticaseibacillus jixianensis TaxID=2486012 RepID=A0ABW4B5G9_9LACO|nr:DegV family protein [Lacticaseibacillus jixianensis]
MYQLLTDSACDLPRQTLEEANVAFVSFHFNVEGQDLTDDMGGSYELKDFFEKIKRGVMPSTSAINVGEYVDFFTPYAKAGTPVAYIAFSSGLSSSFEAATEAKAMVLEQYPDAQIELVDTLAASAGEGRMVLEAIRLQKEGKSLAELVAWFEENRLRLQEWFTVDALDYLYHGGRVSRTSAALGTLLNIKPIMDVDPGGHLRVEAKVRARKRSLMVLGDKILAALPADPQQPVLIAAAGDYAAANEVRDHILSQAPDANVTVGDIGLTIASHTGFGCVAAFVMGAEKRQ